MSITEAQVYFGDIRSVPAAGVFAALYFVFLVGFIVQWVRLRSRVYRILSLFSAIRFTSFILRSVIAGSATANVGLLVGEEILVNIGFFPLLNAVDQLLFDRETAHRLQPLNAAPYPSSQPMSKILRFHAFYRLLILSAITIGSVGLSQLYTSNDPDTISTGGSLHITSAVLFLVLILYLAYQTVMLFRLEGHAQVETGLSGARTNFGTRYGTFILMAISILLLIRQAFVTATARDRFRANNEHLWYPLLALPEILAVTLFAIPGLVPGRPKFLQHSETIISQQEQEKSPQLPMPAAPSRVQSEVVSRRSVSDSPPQLPSDLVISKSEPGLCPPSANVPLTRSPTIDERND